MTWKLWLTAGAVISAAIVGCTVGPNFRPPDMKVPDKYAELAFTEATTRAAATRPAVMLVIEWWRTFDDPQLDSLVERATATNLDLQLAQARIRQARAQYGVDVAGEFPTVNTSAGYTRSRSSAVRSAGG